MPLFKVHYVREGELLVNADSSREAEGIVKDLDDSDLYNDLQTNVTCLGKIEHKGDIPDEWLGCYPYGNELGMKKCEDVVENE